MKSSIIVAIVVIVIAVVGFTLGGGPIEKWASSQFGTQHVTVDIKPSSSSVAQGKSLSFSINKSTTKYPVRIDDRPGGYGFQLQYLGMNPNGSAPVSGPAAQVPYGIMKPVMSNNTQQKNVYWNTTLVTIFAGEPHYFEAPAGYYKLIKGSQRIGYDSNINLSINISPQLIKVTGIGATFTSNATESVVNTSWFDHYASSQKIQLSAEIIHSYPSLGAYEPIGWNNTTISVPGVHTFTGQVNSAHNDTLIFLNLPNGGKILFYTLRVVQY